MFGSEQLQGKTAWCIACGTREAWIKHWDFMQELATKTWLQ